MMKNMLNNGGFEAADKATVMLSASTSNSSTFVQELWPATSAHPDGYWDGADYLFLTGANKDKMGQSFTCMQVGEIIILFSILLPLLL